MEESLYQKLNLWNRIKSEFLFSVKNKDQKFIIIVFIISIFLSLSILVSYRYILDYTNEISIYEFDNLVKTKKENAFRILINENLSKAKKQVNWMREIITEDIKDEYIEKRLYEGLLDDLKNISPNNKLSNLFFDRFKNTYLNVFSDNNRPWITTSENVNFSSAWIGYSTNVITEIIDIMKIKKREFNYPYNEFFILIDNSYQVLTYELLDITMQKIMHTNLDTPIDTAVNRFKTDLSSTKNLKFVVITELDIQKTFGKSYDFSSYPKIYISQAFNVFELIHERNYDSLIFDQQTDVLFFTALQTKIRINNIMLSLLSIFIVLILLITAIITIHFLRASLHNQLKQTLTEANYFEMIDSQIEELKTKKDESEVGDLNDF
jgi:hypothetical protein